MFKIVEKDAHKRHILQLAKKKKVIHIVIINLFDFLSDLLHLQMNFNIC